VYVTVILDLEFCQRRMRTSRYSRVGSWQPLLEKLQLFKDVVDKIAEVFYLAKYISSSLSHGRTLRFQVHPYAKMAWAILSAILQVCHHATENLSFR
jgi:hypothetical protein